MYLTEGPKWIYTSNAHICYKIILKFVRLNFHIIRSNFMRFMEAYGQYSRVMSHLSSYRVTVWHVVTKDRLHKTCTPPHRISYLSLPVSTWGPQNTLVNELIYIFCPLDIKRFWLLRHAEIDSRNNFLSLFCTCTIAGNCYRQLILS